MPHLLRARYSRSNKPKKATRRGIYPASRDIQPAPQCAYVSARFALPIGYVLSLQKMYPDKTINMAIKAYLIDSLRPRDVKEIEWQEI